MSIKQKMLSNNKKLKKTQMKIEINNKKAMED
jgi:hypothetical protein